MGIAATVIGGAVGRSIGRRGGKFVAKVTGASKRNTKGYKDLGGALGQAYGMVGANFIPIIGSFKKGGEVKETGAYILHKGEHVVPTSQVDEKIKKTEAKARKAVHGAEKKGMNIASKSSAKASKINEKANAKVTKYNEKKNQIKAILANQ